MTTTLLPPLFKHPFLILLFLSLSICTANAQRFRSGDDSSDPSYGVAITAGYDAPVGNLSYTFKATPAYSVSFLKFSDDFIANATIGYHVYKPKQSTFYYAVNDNDYGTIQYQNFTALEFYIGEAYRLELTNELKIYAGINLGAYFTHYAYNSADDFIIDSENLHEEDVYLAPKLGVNYNITNDIGIGVEGKYNFFAPTGDSRYTSRVGTLYNSYTASLSFYYTF